MSLRCSQCRRDDQLLTCNGCEQFFCDEHVAEHQNQLSERMDQIERKYRQFEEDLKENEIIQSHLARVDQWERDSLAQIKKTAELARYDLLQMCDRLKKQLKSSIEKIDQTMQSNRETKTYTEINLKKWTEQLKQLQHRYTASLPDQIIHDSQSSIPLIKIIDSRQSFAGDELDVSPREKFRKTVGLNTLSEDRRTVTCYKSKWNGFRVSGKTLYSSGIHSIRFRINQKGAQNLFFGMTSANKDTNPWNRKTPFAYGWWDFPSDNDSKEEEDEKKRQKRIRNLLIRADDEIILTMDCLNSEIELTHPRTNRSIHELITYEQCPFPWTVALVLYSPGDSVSILS